jgi:iron complex outermembrane receptor protein
VIEPIRNISLSFDFYRIKKNDFITPNTSQLSQAIAAYYAGTPLPAGYSAIAGAPDPNLPNAKPELGFVSYSFTNLGTETSSGYDIGATARFNLPYGIKYTSVFDGNYVLRLNLNPDDGAPVQHYAGTIGPFNDVAAGGTPKFKANWTNTFAYGPFVFSTTAYFVDGYQLQAEDFGDTTGVCIANGGTASGVNATYIDGTTPIACKVKPFWDIDAHASYQIRSYLQLYVDVQNLFDRRAPYDPTTYGGTDYNSTFAARGILGRYFKFGVRASF